MTIHHQLKLLRKYAGNCRWSHSDKKFQAVFGTRGIKLTLRSDAPAYVIKQMAQQVERELIQAKKGEEHAKELWPGKTGKHLDSDPLPQDLGANRESV